MSMCLPLIWAARSWIPTRMHRNCTHPFLPVPRPTAFRYFRTRYVNWASTLPPQAVCTMPRPLPPSRLSRPRTGCCRPASRPPNCRSSSLKALRSTARERRPMFPYCRPTAELPCARAIQAGRSPSSSRRSDSWAIMMPPSPVFTMQIPLRPSKLSRKQTA